MPPPDAPSPPEIRARAALALSAVKRGRHLETLIGANAPPLLSELAYGACRRYFSLCAEVDARLTQPLRERDAVVHALLVVGLYQLRHTRIPVHAAVAETVAAASRLKRPWARALVNAVLRRLAAAPSPTPCSPSQRWDHPGWMLEAFTAAWPEDCPSLFAANNARAPMALRVNVARTSVPAYRNILDAAGFAHRSTSAPATLVLDAPARAETLPGYGDGLVSVQDEAAQLAATLLPSGNRVLDACAAPGGKTFHLVETHPNTRITALDASPARMQRLLDEAARLGHRVARTVTGDATESTWWDGAPFDCILLDAPCSGTGTLRRHPDIKVSRLAQDAARAARQQQAMLDNLWRMVSSGGTLLYCTCSILPEENDAVVGGFLRTRPDATPIPIDADWGRPTQCGRAVLPTPGGPDGFYYARLRKA